MTSRLAVFLERYLAWWSGALSLGIFYGPLFAPSRALIARDLPFLHLPLRTAFVRLAEDGLPLWNPFLHGGQPILSNPHYAAFYPFTWLHLVLPLPYSLNLLVLLHAAIGFAGTFVLLRCLHRSRTSAALAAISFAGGGALFSLPSVFNLFCAVSWLPWTLVCAVRLTPDGSPHTTDEASVPGNPRWLLASAATLVLPLLAGSPAGSVMGGLALALVVLARSPSKTTIKRVAIIGLLAAGLGAVQWLPTAERVSGTSRQDGLDAEVAGEWSSTPARLLELLVPHTAGDVGRDEEQLYFGWELHDKGFPLVLSMYPGLLISWLALAGIMGLKRAQAKGFLWLLLLGLLLALGRHTPLFSVVQAVPVLRSIRYPEKFLCLVSLAWLTLAAFGWDELFRSKSRLFKRLVGVMIALPLAVLTVSWTAPGLTTRWIRYVSGELSVEALQGAAEYLQGQLLIWLASSVVLGGLLLACRRSPARRFAWSLLAILFLLGDLWWAGHYLNPTGPSQWLSVAPEDAKGPERILSTLYLDSQPEVGLALAADAEGAVGTPGLDQMRTKLDRLDPYSGLLFGQSYVLHEDYDLLLTEWGRHGLRLFEQQWENGTPRKNIAAAWAAHSAIVRRPPQQMLAEYQATGRRPSSARWLPIEDPLPVFRFVEQALFTSDLSQALTELDQMQFDVSSKEILLTAPPAEAAKERRGDRKRCQEDASRRLHLLPESRAARLQLQFEQATPCIAVAAMTFDRGWSASLDEQSVTLHPTALGQIGFELPAGSGTLELVYSDARVRVGLAISLLTALLALLGLSRSARTTANNEASRVT